MRATGKPCTTPEWMNSFCRHCTVILAQVELTTSKMNLYHLVGALFLKMILNSNCWIYPTERVKIENLWIQTKAWLSFIDVHSSSTQSVEIDLIWASLRRFPFATAVFFVSLFALEHSRCMRDQLQVRGLLPSALQIISNEDIIFKGLIRWLPERTIDLYWFVIQQSGLEVSSLIEVRVEKCHVPVENASNKCHEGCVMKFVRLRICIFFCEGFFEAAVPPFLLCAVAEERHRSTKTHKGGSNKESWHENSSEMRCSYDCVLSCHHAASLHFLLKW